MIGMYTVSSADEEIEVFADNDDEARTIAGIAWGFAFDEPMPDNVKIETKGQMPDFDDFIQKYSVLENSLSEDASFNNTLFETYGPELEHIADTARRNPRRVWTLLETDGDYNLIANGMHHVNRLGYFITEEEGSDEEEAYYCA